MLIQLVDEPSTLFFDGYETTVDVKLFWVSERCKLRNVRLYFATDSKRSLCFHTQNLVKHRREKLEVHRLLAWTFKCPLWHVRWACGCDVDHRSRMHHDNAVDNVDVRLTSDHRSEAGSFGGLQSGIVRRRKVAAREQRKAAAKASAKARREKRASYHENQIEKIVIGVVVQWWCRRRALIFACVSASSCSGGVIVVRSSSHACRRRAVVSSSCVRIRMRVGIVVQK